MNSSCFLSVAGLLAAVLPAQSIAYPIRTTQLAASASYYQIDLGNCVRGDWKPSATVNGLLHGNLISCPEYDGWATGGQGGESQDQYILWTFQAGAQLTKGMQILQTYSVFQYPLYLTDFEMSYTTSSSPSLQSQFNPLPLTRLSGVSGYVSGNNVRAFPGAWSSSGQDYRVEWDPTAATAIRLHVYPNGGAYAGGYVITEVSFDPAPISGRCDPFGTGCPGSNGVPSLACNAGSPPKAGSQLDVDLAHLPITNRDNVFMILGFNKNEPPIDLGLIGMSGCNLYVTHDLIFTNVRAALGRGSWSINMPDFPGLAFYLQAIVVDPSVGGLPLTVTNALACVVGSR